MFFDEYAVKIQNRLRLKALFGNVRHFHHTGTFNTLSLIALHS